MSAVHDNLDGWETYLEKVEPVLQFLQSKGLTVGEALIVVELNVTQRVFSEMAKDMTQLHQQVGVLAKAIRRASDDGDEGWKGDQH